MNLRLIPILLLTSPALAQLPPPPAPPENPITAEKAILGKILFWDEQLSSDNTMACGTCHMPGTGGQDPRAVAPTFAGGQLIGGEPRHPGPDGLFETADDVFGSSGVIRADAQDDFSEDVLFGFGVQTTGRSTPDFMGTAYFDELFWDGRAGPSFVDPQTGLVSIPSGGALEAQAVGPVVSPVEMSHGARDWDQVTAKLGATDPLALASDLTPDILTTLGQFPSYADLFEEAFGTPDITAERIAYAIATYERTLVPDDTPYDRYIGGDTSALSDQQITGLDLFRNKYGCTNCHVEPLLSDGDYHALGLTDPALDPGRQAVTGLFSDRGKFKTPGLRNANLRQQMMHDGVQELMFDVLVVYILGGGVFDDNKDPLLAPIAATLPEVQDILSFLTAGLIDERVRNELPPFDRPTLAMEDPERVPVVQDGGVAGLSGEIPTLVVSSPPSAAVPGFKIGIAGALGGAEAFLVIGSYSPGPPGSGFGAAHPQLRLAQAITLPGTGLDDGFATYHFQPPALAVLVGTTVRAQWWVVDPGAPGQWAKSPMAFYSPF